MLLVCLTTDIFNDTSIRIFWKLLFSLDDILYFFIHNIIYDLMVFFEFLSMMNQVLILKISFGFINLIQKILSYI